MKTLSDLFWMKVNKLPRGMRIAKRIQKSTQKCVMRRDSVSASSRINLSRCLGLRLETSPILILDSWFRQKVRICTFGWDRLWICGVSVSHCFNFYRTQERNGRMNAPGALRKSQCQPTYIVSVTYRTLDTIECQWHVGPLSLWSQWERITVSLITNALQ